MNKLIRRMTAGLLTGVTLLLLAGCGKNQSETVSAESTAAPTVPPVTQAPSGVQKMLLVSLTDYQLPSSSQTLRNDHQADFILLMTMDEDAGTTTAVQIDPDMEVDFRPQGAAEAKKIPLGEVYTYGSGGSDSNLNLLTAVSKLMENVRIDHYLTFESDAIQIVTDMLGGVTVNVTDPFPEEYPELAKGGSVCLDGKNADVFFHYVAPDAADNAAHMRRQQEFIRGVYGPFSAGAEQEEFVTRLSMNLGDKMSTDLTLSQMLKMMETLQAYQLDDSIQMMEKGDT